MPVFNCSTVRCSHCKQIREGGNCLPLVIMNSIKPLELVECWITRILYQIRIGLPSREWNWEQLQVLV